MSEEELAAWVALHAVEGAGAASLGRLVARFGSAAGVLAASAAERESVARVPALVLDGIGETGRHMERHRAVAGRLRAAGIAALRSDAPGYPTRLHALASPPPLLYVRGAPPADRRPSVGIVGTTEPSEQGLRAAARAARGLARAGRVIVSGHARGIDAAAHYGAFAAGGTTVLVLPTGILRFRSRRGYPPGEELCRRAAVLSEVHPEAGWATRAALARNRLVAALSDALLVVETGESGGALSTLRHAIGLGRRAFVVRFRRPSLSAAGNRAAEELGAQPVRSLADLQRRLDQPDAPPRQTDLPWRKR